MLSYIYRFGVLIDVDGREGFEYATFGRVFVCKPKEKISVFKNIPIHVDWALGLKIQSTMYNTRTAIVLLNNKTFNLRDIKKHPSIQFSPLIDSLLK